MNANTDNTTHIQILKEVPFFGPGDTLENRLRKVSLRGYEDVAVYKDASIQVTHLDTDTVEKTLYTPQPHLHTPYLDRVNQLAELFREVDINIFQLEKAYDYVATSITGEETMWTMLPPVIEEFDIPQHPDGGFNYLPLIGKEVATSLTQNNWELNPAAAHADYHNTSSTFSLINDGSHRVHAGVLNGGGITILKISGMTPGFPYYAIPQHYSTIRVFENRDESEDLKIYVISSPGQKQLYRLFPSGGIMSGGVRPPREGEQFV
jgi:hypothetical protein